MTVSASPVRSVGTAADVISALAGIEPGSALAQLRDQRPEATQHAQGSYGALFDPVEPTGLTPCERLAVALRVATIHAAPEAIDHYRRRLIATGAAPEVVAAAENVARQGGSPQVERTRHPRSAKKPSTADFTPKSPSRKKPST